MFDSMEWKKKRLLCIFVLLSKFVTVLSSCKVTDFAVQPNFDLKKYVGVTWYEQSWLPAPSHSSNISDDFTHTYYLHPDGSTITAFINGRNPPDFTECFYYTNEFVTTEEPGKWLRKHAGYTTDYWIVSTDYTSYSLSYGCREQNAAGECTLPLVWVWSRKPEKLSPDKMDVVENIINTLCVHNMSRFFETGQNNECSENRDCRLYSIDNRRQQDFDIQRYAGKWYEISWLPQFFIPADDLFQDYQHVYDLNSDGTFLTAFIRGRNPVDLSKCFYNQGELIPATEPGKFHYRRKLNDTYIIVTDYWVMSTDYVNYAVIYGCQKFDKHGMCTYADSWIWSRYPSLPATVTDEVENIKNSLCVNATIYLPTQQTQECPKDRDCKVASITQRSMESLDLKKLGGLWYQYKFMSKTITELFTNSVQFIDTDGTDAHTVKVRTKVRQAGECKSDDFVIHQTGQGGKILTTSKVNNGGTVQQESYLMGTDYTNFYLEYSCQSEDGNSKCSKPLAVLWTRIPSPSIETMTAARQIIIGLCLNYDSFTTVEHTHDCPTSSGMKSKPHLLLLLLYILAVITNTW